MKEPHTQYALDEMVKYLQAYPSQAPRPGRVSVHRLWKCVSHAEGVPMSGLQVTVLPRKPLGAGSIPTTPS